MAKKTLLTIDGVHRKVKDQFITIDSVYRRIKKAYITVGGVYRPLVSGEPEYWGLTSFDPLATRTGHTWGASTTINDCAIFAGGFVWNYMYEGGSCCSKGVSTVDSLLNIKAAPDLPTGSIWHAATTVGNYALIGGGYYEEYGYDELHPNDGLVTTIMEYLNSITAYDASLTSYESVSGLYYLRGNIKATTVGNYALFGSGGYQWIEAYNDSLTKQASAIRLGVSIDYPEAITLGDYALFGNSANLYGIDSSLTNSITVAGLDGFSNYSTAVATEDYAIFSCNSGGYFYIYDKTMTQRTTLTQSGYEHTAATVLGDYILFHNAVTNNVVIYDKSLTLVKTIPLDGGSRDTLGRTTLAETVGNYALFTGHSNTISEDSSALNIINL